MPFLRPPKGGEERLHAIFRSAWRKSKGRGGPGDDCAELRAPNGAVLAWTTDQVALGIHARAGTRPALLARKLLRRTLSDLAAAGAQPWAVTWTLAAPAAWPPARLAELARSFLAEARRFRVPVVGGDCSRAGAVVLTASALGLAPASGAPGRGGARAGDELWVTGALGNAVRSGRHLRPEPRLKAGRLLATRYHAHALMDLSDGLARDLPRMLLRSRMGAEVELADLPLARGLRADARGRRSALEEGEDYELLVALAPADARRAARNAELRKIGFTRIGRVMRGRRLVWLLAGRARSDEFRGYEHQWGKSR